jgi:hypothetical protein
VHTIVLTLACALSLVSVSSAFSQPAVPRPPDAAAPVRDRPMRADTVPRAGAASISGTVISAATGQPAAGARVMVNGEPVPGGRSVTTDDQGRFLLSALPAGRYAIRASKPGHVATAYGQRRFGGPGRTFELADGQTHTITLQLPRGAVITGMILDERGEPSINSEVNALRFVPSNGRRRPQPSGHATTDDRGIYRLHSLSPGDYVICANNRRREMMTDAQRIQSEMDAIRRHLDETTGPNAAETRKRMQERLAQLRTQLPTDSEPTIGYAPVCFPGGASSGSPSLISVAAGEERSGLDFQLTLVPVAQIEGTIVLPAAGAGAAPDAQSVEISLVNRDELTTELDRHWARPEASGRFTFRNVAPGQYRLIARTMQNHGAPVRLGGPGAAAASQGSTLWAALDVAVAGQDITNFALELQRGMTISGQVAFHGTTVQPPSDVTRAQVNINPVNAFDFGRQLATHASATVDANGRFTIRDVLPGTYRIAGGTPDASGWMLQSVTISGQDALDHPLEVKPGQNVRNVVITFTDQVSELLGTIANEKGAPALDHTILLFPADEKQWTPESRRIRVSRAMPDGRFTFRMVPPGEYRLAAFLDAESGGWFDPGFLEQLSSSSVRLSIAEGEKKVQDLRVSSDH